ncbi:MAG: EAL domain-containing protein, partial [Clostridia bacterium]|nr:EAL domain-containing protein [Clostridia bacterium]
LTWQPIVTATDGRPFVIEAKAVWHHPEFGSIFANEWTLVAETSRLIIPLQDWQIHQACRQMVQWQKQGLGDFRIGCAISPVWFESPLGDVAITVRQAIARTGLDPKRLVLFIPEAALADKPEEVFQTLMQLHNTGVQLMLDKFGTGYAAMRWLDQLPLLGLRLDPALVVSMDDPEQSPQLLKSLLTIAQSLSFLVVAAQIESKAQLEALRRLGCDAFQGTFVEPSMHEDGIKALIREGRHDFR